LNFIDLGILIYSTFFQKQKKEMICNFCCNSNHRLLHNLNDIRHKTTTEYHLVACENCGLLYLDPQPDDAELDAVYSQDYQCFVGAIEETPSFIARWAQLYGLNRRCKTILKYKKSGILLDIGCSTGNFLNQMQKNEGWQVIGIEPTLHAAQFASDHYKLNIYTTDLIASNFPPSKFDAVTLWDVLEHTHNPREHLQEIFRILQPNGIIVIKAPNPASFEARLFGKYWVGYDAPAHLFGFPPKVLINQLVLCGYNDIQVLNLGSDFATLFSSINLWVAGQNKGKPSKMLEKLSQSHFARIIAFPLLMLLRYLGFGSSKTYIARKPG
jgi:2-polyprenyl-3-methyl-5-hydroxy-6-metoxy-1,4-benzoquinol methylase